jgi:hypothetical protein
MSINQQGNLETLQKILGVGSHNQYQMEKEGAEDKKRIDHQSYTPRTNYSPLKSTLNTFSTDTYIFHAFIRPYTFS